MKSRDGKSQRRAEKKKEDQKRESLRRKKIQVREKVGKSRNTVFFQWFVAPEGRKVGSLKRRVRSPLGRWEMKNCTPLWREAQFEVKMHKAHQLRTTFGSWDVEKVHGVVARSTFWTQNLQSTSASERLRSKKCTPLCREAHVDVKKYKAHQLRTTFGSWDVEKVHAVVARNIFRSQKLKKTEKVGALLDVQMSFCVVSARDCAPCQKWAKCAGLVEFPKTMAGVGHLKRICQDYCSVAGAVQETCLSMFIWDARRSGRWFPERGCILEHQIFSFGKMILRNRCSTLYDLASLFRGRRNTLDRWSGKIANRIGTRPSALHSTSIF